MFGLVSFGLIGFLDDYAKVDQAESRPDGATEIRAANAGRADRRLHALDAARAKGYSTTMNMPFFKQFKPELVIESLLRNWYTYPLAFVFFFGFMMLVIVGSSNAVNLTDGLDGLAIGLMVIARRADGAHLRYRPRDLAQYLDLSRLPGTSELTIFCGSMMGASLGFLWYNAHPAEIFMGDVGSLGLGGALGVVAVLIKQEMLLLFIGGIFMLEALSVILQVGSYKLRKKRIFKMAPIHHHFERWVGRNRKSSRAFGSPAWCWRCSR